MRDGNLGSRGFGAKLAAGLFLPLAFTAAAASGGDNAAYVSYSGVPSAMHPGDTATVTVTMRNTGTTTWKTTVETERQGWTPIVTTTTYSLDAVGDGWDVSSVLVTGSVAPNATRSFQFTIEAPSTAGNYTFQWRMRVTSDVDGVSSGTSFGATTPSRTINVAADSAPSFGNEDIDPLVWLRGKAIDAVTLPAATGGNGPLSYSLTSCYLPGGLTFDRATRTFSGTPRTAWGPTTCTYKVTDSDDNTAATDADTLDFTIRVKRPVLTVSPTSLTDPPIVEGRSRTFTVRPASEPNGTVTVAVSSDDIGIAGVEPASLTFTRTNYTTTQEVTVTGTPDPDGSDESTTVRLGASGGGYSNVSASVDVAVEDDDSYDPPTVPESLTVPEGDSVTFEVELPTQPTGAVTVSLTSGDTGVATVSPASLSFTTTNYSTPQTVTVTGVADADASDESTSISLSLSGGGYDDVSASVDVTVEDPDTPDLVVMPTELTVNEGATGTFKVKLATQPTGTVTVSVSSGDSGAAGVSPASLSFTAGNYSTWQTVTVTGKQDADASDESTSIALAASGGDYGNKSASVSVSVTDDDTQGLVVTPASLTSPAIVEGGSRTFTVRLATRPTGTVTVSVTSGDTGAATVSPASLSFTTTNYSTPKTVTVTGKQDADASDESTSIALAASGGDYGSVSASVSVSVTDDDTQGLVVTPTSLTNPAIAEGGSRTFTVALATQPTGTVTVSVSSGDTGAATVSPASLSFSAGNYSTSQTVTVSGAEDADASNESTSISLAASGGDYGSVSSSVNVSVTDNDTQGLVLSATDLDVTEGGTGTFTVALSTQPTGAVTVAVSSGDTGAATVSPASLSFTAADYSTSQTVTVTGVQDADASNENTTVSLSSSGGDYASVSSSVSVEVTDDDTQGLVLGATELSVAEGGNGTFTVALATQPTGAVTVTVSSDDTGAATVSPASLSFTSGDYSTSQTVTVTGVQDPDSSNESASISLGASGGDYGNVSSSVSVTVTDDDTQGLVLSATELTVAEGGNGTFTVALSTQPTGTVTVTVTSGDTGAATVSPASLSFTAADYSTSQTVTVTGVQDDDADNESATVSLAASGGDYGNVSSSVSVTVTDDDTTGLALSATDLSVAEGGNGTFTVALSTEPTSTVTVAVSSGDTGAATVSPASLSFTAADYSTSQTVTVTGVQDDDADNDSATVSLSASGGGYANVSSSVSVTVTDDDTQGMVLSATELSVAEGGNGTFTVALSTQPTGTVTVTVSSGDTAAATVSPASLSFTTTDYSTSQTVTVTGVQDDDADNDSANVSLSASGGDYGSVSSSVSVTVMDDDSETPSPPAGTPSFGTVRILDQTWVKDTAISSLTLPAATGGDGDLTYSLTGTLPAGVTFDALTRALSGTPTKKQAATAHTYTATDEDGDAASLSFTIRVAGQASDNASFVSYAGVPSTMAAGSSATVTVRMRNDGTTTWTSSAGYELGSQRPPDNTRWGLSRVSLPSAVPPNATADFTFAITAPTELGSYKFRWRMVLGTGVRFGAKTELRVIEVEANESPSFGASTILSQTWVKNTAINSLALPTATGGNGDLTYALTGTLPAGVTFDASTRTLSGTPTAEQAATQYTYTATDTDDDAVSLSFTIRVAGQASDNATFVSYAGVPSRIAAGSSATVTVRMRNDGTTTWTSSADYELGSQRPPDNTTWGLSRVSLPSDVAPNATADFTFTITAPETTGSYKFRWRMIRGTSDWFGDKTESRTITVEDPSFGDATIDDQAWVVNTPIDTLTLPAASGGDGALTYALAPALPTGVTFTESTRMVSGAPTAVQAKTQYSYTATDTDGDAATLSFEIGVAAAPADNAAFVSSSGVPSKIVAGGTATVTVTMKNTGSTTWTSSDDYELGSQSPSDNTTWGLSRVSVPSAVAPNGTAAFTFTITAPETTGSHVFAWRMVKDTAWFGAGTGSVTITVEDPSFGDTTIADQTWVRDTAIETLTLPAASGGDGALTYALTPSLPDGVTFTASTRTVSGTPTTLQATTKYTYTATDTDGDAATLSFEIAVEAATVDDAAFVSSSGVPSKMVAGGTATVTVTMKNTGTTTWTSSADYELGSQIPSDNDTWGLSRVSLPSDVAPKATAAFTFTITAPDTTGSYVFAWRMVKDTAWFGAGTASVTITVEDPSFGDATVANQTWVKDTAITALTLPEASGGDGALTYTLTPSLPAGVAFAASTRTLSGTPTVVQAKTDYTYTATDEDGDTATLSFAITVNQATSSSSSSSSAASVLPPQAPTGVFDMFEYWLLPRGSAMKLQARLQDGRIAPAAGSSYLRSFWRGELWGRKLALLGDPDGRRFDIFEEAEDGLDYWGTFEGGAAGVEARLSTSLDRPFRWMHRFMAVGDVVESPVTGRWLSSSRRNQESMLEATMRLEVVAHHASFEVPAVDGLMFEDVLEVRFWPDAGLTEAHETFFLAPGYGAVYSRRSAVAAAGGVVEWWAVEKALTPVVPSAPSVPWFDPFSPGWPKTAVLNGNMDDLAQDIEGGQVGSYEVPGWTADSSDALIARPPSGLDAGSWSMLLRGSEGGGDGAPDVALTEDWIPVEGGTYQLSACMLRENAGDNVLVDFDDGKGRDADFADAHLVATSIGAWECRAVTKCIPGSVGAVRIRAVRDGANLGDAWFDRIELKRIAACTEQPRIASP